jgi:hypothetical protein
VPPAVANALLDQLDRIVPLAAAVARGIRTAALAGAASVAVIAAAVFAEWRPEAGEDQLAVGILLLLLAAPPVVLVVLWLTVREVAELPERLRSYPDVSRGHAAELRDLAEEARRRERPAWRRLPGSTWRLARLVAAARDLLTPYAPLVALVSPPFLVASALALAATPVLVLAAVVVALVAL